MMDKTLLKKQAVQLQLNDILMQYHFLKEENEFNDFVETLKIRDSKTLDITIFVHGDCNFRCKYCYETFTNINIPAENQNKIIDFIKNKLKDGTFTELVVNWFGGEPLLSWFRIMKMTDKLKRMCVDLGIIYKAGITTNGYLLNSRILNSMLSCDVTTFQISIDGNEVSHNAQRVLRDGSGSYATIYQNLRYMQNTDAKFTVLLRFNISADNQANIEDFLNHDGKYFRKDSRFQFFFKRIGDWGLGERKIDYRVGLARVDADIYLCRRAIALGYNIMNIKFVLNNYQSVCYGRLPNSYSINIDGNIIKCTTKMLYDQKNRLGNINDGLIDQAKNSFWSDNYHYRPQCQDCRFFPLCRGGACPIDINGYFEAVCRQRKSDIRKYFDLLITENDFAITLLDEEQL